MSNKSNKTDFVDLVRAWLGDSVEIRSHERDRDGHGAAWICVEEKIIFSFAPHLLPLLCHDVGHVLAATDEELFLPNLGLSVNGPARDGDDKRRAWEAQNEERVLAYQTVLTRHLVGATMDGSLKRTRDLLRIVSGLVEANVDALIATLTIEKVKAEWDRKVALVRERSAELVGV